MEKFKVEDLSLLGEDERGSTYELMTRPTGGFLFASRKKGAVSGNHWHEGKSASKNPEILFLISGEMKVDIKDLESGEEGVFEISGPVKVSVYPRALHTFTSLSDCSFLEFNSLAEHKADAHYPEK